MKKLYFNGYFLLLVYVLTLAILYGHGLFDRIYEISRAYEDWEIDEIVISFLPMSILVSIYAYGKYLEQKETQKKIVNILRTDPSSGLPNKISFESMMENNRAMTVILIKMLNIESLNTTFGLEFADRILLQACNRLDELSTDIFQTQLYRIDSNLFGIIVQDMDCTTVYDRTQEMQKRFNESVIGKDGKFFMTIICGISGTNPLYHTAKIALEHVKKHPNKIICEYTPNIIDTEEKLKSIHIFNLIKQSIQEDSIILYFQPILDNRTNEYARYEILMRLAEPNGKIITPDIFLPLAKTFRLYPDLTRTVINKSFTRFQDEKDCFSINFSWLDLIDRETMDYFFDRLERYPDCAKRLTIEITETENIGQQALLTFRKKLKTFGGKLAIDDFGSGYSNWAILRDLAPDFIKIDGSLIQQIDSNTEVRMAVEAIVSIAKTHNIRTIAEYVSTEEIQRHVLEIGIDMSQGYLAGLPSPELMPQHLRHNSRKKALIN